MEKFDRIIHAYSVASQLQKKRNIKKVGQRKIQTLGQEGFTVNFMRKMGDFEAACQNKLKVGKGLEASRATKFLSKSSAHR